SGSCSTAPGSRPRARATRRSPRATRTTVPSGAGASLPAKPDPEESAMPVIDQDQEKAAKARDAALKGALGQIEREFGKGTVMRMGDEGAQVRVDAIPTGALSLDIALGIGGVPKGRIVE